MEVAVNVPFDSGEICHIIGEELQARLRQLSPLQGAKEYSAFAVEFQVKIRLRRVGEDKNHAKETLAWGTVAKGELGIFDTEHPDMAEEVLNVAESFESKDPNEERVARDMPLTIETGDGRGGKIRKKARVKA